MGGVLVGEDEARERLRVALEDYLAVTSPGRYLGSWICFMETSAIDERGGACEMVCDGNFFTCRGMVDVWRLDPDAFEDEGEE